MLHLTKIIQGFPISVQSIPFLVLLLGQNLMTRQYFVCSGSHLQNGWVLSAAHCAQPNTQFYIYSYTNRVIDAFHENAYNVNQFLVHPEYNSTTFRNDLALFHISNYTLLPQISIDPVLDHYHMYESISTELCIAGFGTTQTNDLSMDSLNLHEGIVHIKNSHQYPDLHIDETMLLAGGDTTVNGSITDSCQGDSGGPLFLFQNSSPFIIGVVSWGISCGLPQDPGVYAKISSSLSWILSKIR